VNKRCVQVVRAHVWCNVSDFIAAACIIRLRLKWYEDYNNRLRLAEVSLQSHIQTVTFFMAHNIYIFDSILHQAPV